MARALQIAILKAATSHFGDPLMWAGFIHVGGMGSRSLSDVRGNANDEEDSKKTDDESGALEDETWEQDSTPNST